MPKRSVKDAAETRERIAQAAQVLFAERGYAGTSAMAIAKASGVTDGALFHHFKDKRSLFTEIAVRLHAEVHKTIYRAGKNEVDPMEGFRKGARASMEVTQRPHIQQIVFIDGPAVLGTEEWRKIDQELGLRLNEGGLLRIADVEELPDAILKPMAMLALGTINEITYALIRKEPGVDPEQCLNLVERAVELWLRDDVAAWKADQIAGQKASDRHNAAA